MARPMVPGAKPQGNIRLFEDQQIASEEYKARDPRVQAPQIYGKAKQL